jgi:hypothetical protein
VDSIASRRDFDGEAMEELIIGSVIVKDLTNGFQVIGKFGSLA